MSKWVRSLLAPALLLGCAATTYSEDIQLWGYPIERWFEERLPVTMNDPVAYLAFEEFGTNALPFLIGILEHEPSLLAKTADQLRIQYSTGPKMYSIGGKPAVPPGPKFLDFAGSAVKVNERRYCAARLIGELGTNGASVIPRLVKIWKDPNEDPGVQYSVLEAMVSMGSEVARYLPDLMNAAKSTNGAVRDVGITLISHCGAKGRAAIPMLRDLVDHGNPDLAGEAAEALWKVDRQTNIALRVFSGFLTTFDTEGLGIKYLAEMGEAARPLIPVLMTHLADTNRNMRTAVEALIRILDPEMLTPINAKIKSDAAANVANIIADINGTNAATRYGALMAIKMYGPDAHLAVPALIDVIKRGDDYEPRYAVDALAEIGPAASPAVPALIAIWRAESYSVIPALGRLGPAARDALPFLEKELKSMNPVIRWRAADAILRIAPQNASNVISVFHELEHLPLLPVYSDKMRRGDPPIAWRPDPSSNYCRLAAEVSLWKIGLVQQPPVSEIIDEMENPNRKGIGTSGCIQLLRDIGPAAKAALPVLEKCLAPDAYPKREAAIAIQAIDPKEAERLNLPGELALP